MVNAVGEAMRQAMEADPSVIVMGEDVAGGAGRGGEKENSMGGSFGATKSLYPLFGANRVRDTPISEAGFVGAGVGAAAAGLRPVIDAMWADFTGLAFDQIYNQAGKMSYMFGGQVRLPLTIRVAMGCGLSAAAQHSGTLYSIYTHLPGIKVVVPSTPYDAKGLLLESIFDDSPVMFFEHLKLYVSQGPGAGGAVPHTARGCRDPPTGQRRHGRRDLRRWWRGRSKRRRCSLPRASTSR